MAERDHHGDEHVPGSMDIEEQRRTFDAFIRFWVFVFGGAILILIFLALFNS
jgi:hypothetical protein